MEIPPRADETAPAAPPPVVPVAVVRDGSFRAGFLAGMGVGCGVSLLGGIVVVAALAAIGYWAAQEEAAHASSAPGASVAVTEGGGSAPADAADGPEVAIQDALDAGEFDRAESLAAQHAAGHPEDMDAQALLHAVRIERAAAAEDTAAADAILRSALARELPIGPATIAGVAELWLAEGEPARALELAERAVKDAAPPVPGEPEEDEYDRYSRGYALVVRGMARAEVGDPGAGIRDLEAAIELAPDEETAREWQAALDELRDRAQ